MLVMVLVRLLASSGVARATLWDRGGGLIYDDDLNITWLQDANYATTSEYNNFSYLVYGLRMMTWYQANTWAEELSYYDSVRNFTWDDWRLPTTPSTGWVYSNQGEMGHLYYDELKLTPSHFPEVQEASPFINLQSYIYWSGTESYYDPVFNTYDNAFMLDFAVGLEGPLSKGGYSGFALVFLPYLFSVHPETITY
jgi:hypothetical protein